LINNVWNQSERESQVLKKYEQTLIDEKGFSLAYFFPVRGIVKGTYNWYGWVEEETEYSVEDTGDLGEYALFFHKWAIDHIMSFTLDVRSVSELFSKMYILRKNPLYLNLIGQQDVDINELEKMLSLNIRVNTEIKKRIEKWNS
jgi:hypothetical protein